MARLGVQAQAAHHVGEGEAVGLVEAVPDAHQLLHRDRCRQNLKNLVRLPTGLRRKDGGIKNGGGVELTDRPSQRNLLLLRCGSPGGEQIVQIQPQGYAARSRQTGGRVGPLMLTDGDLIQQEADASTFLLGLGAQATAGKQLKGTVRKGSALKLRWIRITKIGNQCIASRMNRKGIGHRSRIFGIAVHPICGGALLAKAARTAVRTARKMLAAAPSSQARTQPAERAELVGGRGSGRIGNPVAIGRASRHRKTPSPGIHGMQIGQAFHSEIAKFFSIVTR